MSRSQAGGKADDAERREELEARYAELMSHSSELESELEQYKKKYHECLKERDHLSEQFSGFLDTNEDVTSVCRGLQKQNELLRAQVERMEQDKQEKRERIAQEFQERLQRLVEESPEQQEQIETMLLQQEVESLQQQAGMLLQQYSLRDAHYVEQLKTKELELKLMKARCQQQTAVAEKEALQMATKAMKVENQLRGQLSLFAEKFDLFQETLAKSNELFATFKQEMERMQHTIEVLSKEKGSLQRKCEKTDVALIDMVEERNANHKELELLRTKNSKLESLCRALQNELRQSRATGQPQPPPAKETDSAAEAEAETAVDSEAAGQSRQEAEGQVTEEAAAEAP